MTRSVSSEPAIRADEMRVLVTSLNTYSGPYNDGKLDQLGPRLGGLTVAAADTRTIWGDRNHARSGSGYEVVILPLRFGRSHATAQLVRLGELADRVRPNLIHVECEPWQGIAVQSVRLARRLNIPVGVLFAEGGPRLRGLGGLLRRVRGSWVLRRCDYAIGWSTSSTVVAERLAPGIRTETFPATGVSPSASAPGSTERWFGAGSEALPKLAFVGRFAEEKGIDEYMKVCDELSQRMPLRAGIAGGGGHFEADVVRWAETRTWAHSHGLVSRADARALLGAADVLVCPSRTTRVVQEQFGKAAVEAMAGGTPVFAYDCGALAEVIGRGGVVVPEGARDQLLRALEGYLSGARPDESGLPNEARRQAARFTDEALAARLIDVWSTV